MGKCAGLLSLAAALCSGVPALAQDCGCGPVARAYDGVYLGSRYANRGHEGLAWFQADYGPYAQDGGAGYRSRAGEARAADCPAGPGERVISCRYIPFAPRAAAYEQGPVSEPAYEGDDIPVIENGGGYIAGGGGSFGSSRSFASNRYGAGATASASASSYSQTSVQVQISGQGGYTGGKGGGWPSGGSGGVPMNGGGVGGWGGGRSGGMTGPGMSGGGCGCSAAHRVGGSGGGHRR